MRSNCQKTKNVYAFPTLFPRCKKRSKFFVGHFSKKKNVIRNAHNLVNEIGHSYHIFIISNNDRQYIFERLGTG